MTDADSAPEEIDLTQFALAAISDAQWQLHPDGQPTEGPVSAGRYAALMVLFLFVIKAVAHDTERTPEDVLDSLSMKCLESGMVATI